MSNISNWLPIQKKYKNSVVQITTYSGSYSLDAPYKAPDIAKSRGSGFIISDDGFVLTNAHVVDGAITVTFRSEVAGNEDLEINIVAICHHKDVALLKIPDELLELVKPFTPFEFDDDHKAQPTDQVLTSGFPLGKEKLKFTAGIISGYETPDAEEGTSNQSYIQIDASINRGNSGGPLMNAEGKVIGINAAGYLQAQNVGFAIPSRVVLSILRDMFLTLEPSISPTSYSTSPTSPTSQMKKLVTAPRLGVILQQVTLDHFISLNIDNEVDQIGMRVKEIIPGTPLIGIKEGDIIQRIEYSDPYKHEDAFNLSAYRNGVCLRCDGPDDTLIHISRHGDIKLFSVINNVKNNTTKRGIYKEKAREPSEVGARTERSEGSSKRNQPREKEQKQLMEQNFTKDRKVSLPEVLDTIPSNTPLTFTILRGNKIIKLENLPFKNEDLQGISRVYPPFSYLDYLIFGGCVWVPLSSNILNMIGENKHLCTFIPFRNRNEQRVMLAQIFPKTDIEQTKSFEKAEIISTINGQIVNTLDDMRSIISEAYESNTYIIINMKSGNEVTLDPEKIIKQDKYVHDAFSIKPDNFSSSLFEQFN